MLASIPRKATYRQKEMEIRAQLRKGTIATNVGDAVVSECVGEFFSGLFSGSKKTMKKVTSNAWRAQLKEKAEAQIRELWRDFDLKTNQAIGLYESWYHACVSTIEAINLPARLQAFKLSRTRASVENRIKAGVSVLEKLQVDMSTPVESKTQLIRAGEPLSGRRWLSDFVAKAKKSLKVQEPYPSKELLEILESVREKVIVRVLIGPFQKEVDRQKFKQATDLLLRSGKSVEVVSVHAKGKSPFHDRVWIADNLGLSVGTSISGIGLRDTVVQELHDVSEVEALFDEYFSGNKSTHAGVDLTRDVL